MRFKGLFVVTVAIIFFLLLGSVCALDNETVELQAGNTNSSDDFRAQVHDVFVDHEYDNVVQIDFAESYDVKGNLTVYIDDEISYDRPLKDRMYSFDDVDDDYDPTSKFTRYTCIYAGDLKSPLSYGSHFLLAKNVWPGGERTFINTTFNADYYFAISGFDMTWGEKDDVLVYIPKGADGIVTFSYAGKSKRIDIRNMKLKDNSWGDSFFKVQISSYELDLGDNVILARLTGDSRCPDMSAKTTVQVIPKIIPHDGGLVVNPGEKEYITIKVPKRYTGTVKVYNTIKKREYDSHYHEYYYAYYKGSKLLMTVKVTNGVGKIPTAKLSKGGHAMHMVFSSGKYEYDQNFYVDVIRSNPKIKVKMSAKSIYEGGKVKATIKSPKWHVSMRFTVDYEDMGYSIDLDKGKATRTFSKMKVGTHKIRFYIYDELEKVYYSKAFKIKVKSKVSLKSNNVIVKKSAKKVTLKATLKIKGKPAKSKKVSFRIAGKLYKAKTAKNGIAKVTIKKSKLDLGTSKKVKFQVSYGKKTVSRHVTLK